MSRLHSPGMWKIRPRKLQSRFSNNRYIGQIVKVKVESELKNKVVTLSNTIEANHGQSQKDIAKKGHEANHDQTWRPREGWKTSKSDLYGRWCE